MSDITLKELQEQLEALKAENAYLTVLNNLPPSPATTQFGTPRGPVTDEDKARFKASHKNSISKSASVEDNNRLATASKIVTIKDEIYRLKKALSK